MQPIRTAVFPVAGRGTRFLPATKASPKEMLPIVDKPLIQYAVEEAIEAGVEKLVFVTGATKRAIEDHFDVDADLERALETGGKDALLQRIREIIPDHVNCVYLRQGTPLGLGHAVLCARPVVGEEPFYVHLADDLIHAEVGVLRQMGMQFAEHGASILGVETVPADKTGSYGIVALKGERDKKIASIVEKPDPAEAPSNLAVVGRYVLTPKIFELLEATERGAGNEIQLTDAIAALLGYEDVYAYAFDGIRYDCGSKLGYLCATVEYGLRHPELGPRFRAWLDSGRPA